MNTLYPVFLKLKELRLLVVGAGHVGYEKLSFILKSSPDANIVIVAPEISVKVHDVLANYPEANVIVRHRKFRESDVDDTDIVIAATDIPEVNFEIHSITKAKGKLINVADTPGLCDFYLGSIVTKGDLKIGISTNGQSPTFSKRFRQLLEDILPEELDDLIANLNAFRGRIEGDFLDKVNQLNRLTSGLLEKSNVKENTHISL